MMRQTVLVVDDEEGIRQLIAEVLREVGYHVVTAGDGAEAISLLQTPDGIALVVSDINMPKASGFDVAACARAWSPDLPIVLVTGHLDQVKPTALPHPFKCMPKPFNLDALIATVRDMLGGSYLEH